MNPHTHMRSLPIGLQANGPSPATRERAGARSERAQPPAGAQAPLGAARREA